MAGRKSNEALMRNRVEVWSAKLRVTPTVVRVQRMTRKWGSCSSGRTITLAADLSWKSAAFQDFVIAAELLHLRVPNHGKLFRALMTVRVPSWRLESVNR